MPTIAERLHTIAKEVNRVAKSGRNERQKYDYVQAGDVIDSLRGKLLEAGLIVIPRIEQVETYPVGERSVLTTIKGTWTFFAVDTGDTMAVSWAAQGADTGDKGIYKAFTGGLKYLLLNMFLIPTGDDPEKDWENEGGAVKEEKPDEKPERKPAPQIPEDRAKKILKMAQEIKLAKGVKLEPVLIAKLEAVGCTARKITKLNVDQAEDVEAFLTKEAAA